MTANEIKTKTTAELEQLKETVWNELKIYTVTALDNLPENWSELKDDHYFISRELLNRN